MSKVKQQVSAYLNTDLDIKSDMSFAKLAQYFRKSGMIELAYTPAYDKKLSCKWYGSYEVAWSPRHKEPEHTLRAFITLLERLGAVELKEWHRCKSKVFNIGFQSDKSPSVFINRFSCDLLKKISEYGAGIIITIYPEVMPHLKRQQRKR